MGITFYPNQEEGYFVSKFTGEITDDELVNSYKDYFENENWISLLIELVDLSELERIKVTNEGIRRLVKYIENLFIERGISSYYTAIYAPHDLHFGLSRIYEVLANGSSEYVMVFRNLNDAISWINEKHE